MHQTHPQNCNFRTFIYSFAFLANLLRDSLLTFAVSVIFIDEDGEGEECIDPMDLIDPVDILSKVPKDFYEKLEEKKWTLRKESLEALEKLLTENPKLESGEYGVLVNTLKKVITKDSNVVLVAMAGKCLAMLANGLAKRFGIYAMVGWVVYIFKKNIAY